MTAASSSASSTRDRMIIEARGLFAERGFYGASIAQIAAELGLTKQALLHHFGTKERLYGAVFEQVSSELAAIQHPVAEGSDPVEAIVATFVAMVPRTAAETERARLIMRELLDNRRRAPDAGKWYLGDFLRHFIDLLRAVPAWSDVSEAHGLAVTYQWLGAIEYYAVSNPTLSGIFGKELIAQTDTVFADQLAATIRHTLEAGPVGRR